MPRDPVQGEMWLRLAAKDNLAFYGSQLAAAEQGMTREDIEKGKALAAAWKPKRGMRPDEKVLSNGQSRTVHRQAGNECLDRSANAGRARNVKGSMVSS